MAYSESPFSSTSSSYRRRWNYDVFLSFRGEDTRKQFIDHLYSALIQAGIHTFRGDNELPRGEEISLQLLRAIEGSRISVVVFSRNYASSRWFLNELVKIIECRQTIHQVVLPIFYDMDPSDIRKQTGSYAKAFDEHEEHFKEEMEKVNRWREALKQAANLTGYGLKNDTNGYEVELIKRVVNDVACILGNKTLHVAEHPVGISSRVQGVISLLKGARNNVGIVGIHGIAGIGKTTIAKAVFNDLYFGFEGSSFLSGVKEISNKPNGLVELQERLLHDILKPNVWKINNVYEGMNLIKKQLHNKNVLVVFDDVDKREQLEALMGERCWFGDGSKIIVVTKNKHLLTEVEVDGMYHAMELDRDESLQLFSLHAFRETRPAKDYKELSEKVVDYCEGLPLALEILGSHLFGKDKNVWEIDIAHWQNILHDDIQGKLRVNFDALDVDLSEIFLDIACFFVGQDKDFVANIVGARYNCHPEVAFRALIGRSLIAIDTENRLWMHGIVRKMGREIIRQRSLNHPGNCSRIVLPKDAHTVLSKEMEQRRKGIEMAGSNSDRSRNHVEQMNDGGNSTHKTMGMMPPLELEWTGAISAYAQEQNTADMAQQREPLLTGECEQAIDLTGGGIELPRYLKSGWTLLMTNLILEMASAVCDQLGNALVGMVFAFVALLLTTAELIYMERMARRESRNLLPISHHPSPWKPVGTIVEYFGLVGAVWQCVYSTVEYAYARQKRDNPIKMSLLPFIFLLCVAISKLIKTEFIDESA